MTDIQPSEEFKQEIVSAPSTQPVANTPETGLPVVPPLSAEALKAIEIQSERIKK